MRSDTSQIISRLCPEDKYHYTACFLSIFTPLMFNNSVVAVCEDYVCISKAGRALIGQHITKNTWCNDRVECFNGGVDEKYCVEEEEEILLLYKPPLANKMLKNNAKIRS